MAMKIGFDNEKCHRVQRPLPSLSGSIGLVMSYTFSLAENFCLTIMLYGYCPDLMPM